MRARQAGHRGRGAAASHRDMHEKWKAAPQHSTRISGCTSRHTTHTPSLAVSRAFRIALSFAASRQENRARSAALSTSFQTLARIAAILLARRELFPDGCPAFASSRVLLPSSASKKAVTKGMPDRCRTQLIKRSERRALPSEKCRKKMK